MKCSEEVIAKIKEFEGLRLKPYRCSSNILTVGYGHTGKDVVFGKAITEEQAEQLLRDDLKYFERAINLWRKSCTQNEFDALVCLVFNIGVYAFKESTLRKKIDANASITEIEDQWLRWCHSNGKKLAGLERRREWEIELYKKR